VVLRLLTKVVIRAGRYFSDGAVGGMLAAPWAQIKRPQGHRPRSYSFRFKDRKEEPKNDRQKKIGLSPLLEGTVRKRAITGTDCCRIN